MLCSKIKYDDDDNSVVTTIFPYHHITTIPGQLSLAILLWVDETSNGDSHRHCWGRNDECCVTVRLSSGLMACFSVN